MVASGATTATIPVTIINDSTNEGDETVELTLEPGDGYTVGSPSIHTLTITDNDRGGGDSGGGSGGGGGSQPRDRHGNTPADATHVRLRATAPWASSTVGEINTRRDVDYFTLPAPHDGVLVVETTGGHRYRGYGVASRRGVSHGHSGRHAPELPSQRAGRRPGRWSLPLKGNGGRTGAYRLETRLLVGYLENPGPDSFQSGVGVISGWTCVKQDAVDNGDHTSERGSVSASRRRGMGPSGLDTARYPDGRRLCGDMDNGFGLLFNWNRLGDGEHDRRGPGGRDRIRPGDRDRNNPLGEEFPTWKTLVGRCDGGRTFPRPVRR